MRVFNDEFGRLGLEMRTGDPCNSRRPVAAAVFVHSHAH